jgi:hypothetical protein
MDPPLKVTPHFASKEDALAGWLYGLPDRGKLLSSLSFCCPAIDWCVCVLCRLSLADAKVGGGVGICKPLRELAARFARDWVDASSGGGAKCRPELSYHNVGSRFPSGSLTVAVDIVNARREPLRLHLGFPQALPPETVP